MNFVHFYFYFFTYPESNKRAGPGKLVCKLLWRCFPSLPYFINLSSENTSECLRLIKSFTCSYGRSPSLPLVYSFIWFGLNIYIFWELIIIAFDKRNSSFYACKSLMLAYVQLMMIAIDTIRANGLYYLPSFAYMDVIQILWKTGNGSCSVFKILLQCSLERGLFSQTWIWVFAFWAVRTRGISLVL